MGRDGWLPSAVARIHPTSRTPHVAILVTGVILVAVALLLPIQVVGSAASLMFLLTFTLVNLSLVVLRRREPGVERGYLAPLFPWLPLTAAASNLVLAVYQFNFDPLAWYVSLGWIGIGALAYWAFLGRAAEEAAPRVLDIMPQQPERANYRVLVPVANPRTISTLMDLALPLARANAGDTAVTTTVEVPIQLPIQEGMLYVSQRTPLIRAAEDHARGQGAEAVSDIRVAHRIEEGVIAAADDLHADLVVMGWKGFTSTRERVFGEIMDRVVNRVRCDIAVVKLRGEAPFRRILLPTAGGPQAEFAAELLEPIVAAHGAKVTACYVMPRDAGPEEERAAEDVIRRTLRHVDLGEVESRLLRSNSVAAAIAAEGADYDLIVVGAAKKTGLFKQLLFGEIPDRVGRYAPTSVMLVKRREGPTKSWLRRLLS
jgi:nucleotide-binding universal stress UspA family protein